ncbi:transcriptional regulator, AsnC family [Beutenbergia cavernae DSM 12333]|uniref:Transcriptional regulator, AsnC family n=1 Tax=Beutenbergia cavernae (strain ATCC BAA-8 / DSM 12333 / CCUG 43141 / JCM 11478 / NBRC 16432 / NCIMB 13614 / HKI 0122) TaxID=471853 RepID=C5BWA7_BEUC1|nr:winged helix-turn-helix transcriptional regulator [Beutenbergia cavernae]ACQ78565.1 transcriptional regulator, AsnC family [Beutenbergia cavernae DSM 12333]
MMEDIAALQDVDLRITAALLAHPRARVGAIAAAAATSAPTVSRRLATLLDDDVVRVVGVVDQQRADAGFAAFLRLRCVPGASVDVAQALARWPESGYVALIGGDLDCAAQLHVRSTRHLLEITGGRLKALPGVVGSSTLKIIRRFSTPHGWTGGLVPDRALATLRADRMDHWSEERPHTRHDLDELDRGVVAALAEDGRMSWRELAERLGVQPATASRRAEALMSKGLLRLRAVVQPARIGQPVIAFIWLRVAPSRLEAAGRALAAHPNVLNIAATTGQPNLCGEVAVGGDEELYTFLTDDVGSLPGVMAVDVSDGLDVIKRASLVFDERAA